MKSAMDNVTLESMVQKDHKRTRPQQSYSSYNQLDQKDESGHKRTRPHPSNYSYDLLDEKWSDSDSLAMSESSEELEEDSILEVVFLGEHITEMAEYLVEQGHKELIQKATLFLDLLRKSAEVHFGKSDEELLDETARVILNDENIIGCLAELTVVDPQFIGLFLRFSIQNLTFKNHETIYEKLGRMTYDTWFTQLVVEKNYEEAKVEAGVNVMKAALSVLVGYWIDDDYKDKVYNKTPPHCKPLKMKIDEKWQKREETKLTDSPDELDQKKEFGHKRKEPRPTDELDEKQSESEKEPTSESSEEEPSSQPDTILGIVYGVQLITEMAEDLIEQGHKELVQKAVFFLELLRKSVGHFKKFDELINETARGILNDENVVEGFVELITVDPQFYGVFVRFSCKRHEKYSEKTGSLFFDTLFKQLVVAKGYKEAEGEPGLNVMKAALCVLVGYFIDEDYKVKIYNEIPYCKPFRFRVVRATILEREKRKQQRQQRHERLRHNKQRRHRQRHNKQR